MGIETIGIIGAGVIGRGVAQQAAQSGFRVLLVDVDPETLKAALGQIRRDLRQMTLLRPDRAPREDLPTILSRIDCYADDTVLAGADFVIENVTEEWPVKQSVYRQIDSICRATVVFATNSSAIPVCRIAAETARRTRVIGMHFMNPVPLSTAVEVVRTPETTEETLDCARGLAAALGKEAIVVNDSPGYVSNRVLMLMINEAIAIAAENVASPADIDRIFRQCFGHPMGPFETADLIGLDTVLRTLEVLDGSCPGSRFSPRRMLRELVEQGRLGRKNGQGFFTYGANF